MATKHQTQATSTHTTPTSATTTTDEQLLKTQSTPDLLGAVQRVQQAPATLTPSHMLHLQRTLGNQAVQRMLATSATSGAVIQRVKLQDNEVTDIVNSVPRINNQKWSTYVTKLEKKFKRNWSDNQAFAETEARRIWFNEGTGEVNRNEVTEEVVGRRRAVMLSQVPINHQEMVTNMRAYLGNNYQPIDPAGRVTVDGDSRTVYELSDTEWGYIDTAHGEIEVVPNGQRNGTTLGYKSLVCDYEEVEKTLRGIKSTVYRITNTYERPLVRGKTHQYYIN